MHHLVVDAAGTPLNVVLTWANRHDSTQFMSLLDGLPPIVGKRGRPLGKPKCVQAAAAMTAKCIVQSFASAASIQRLANEALHMAVLLARRFG